MKNDTVPFTMRFYKATVGRLKRISDKTGLTRQSIADHGINKELDHIEKHGTLSDKEPQE